MKWTENKLWTNCMRPNSFISSEIIFALHKMKGTRTRRSREKTKRISKWTCNLIAHFLIVKQVIKMNKLSCFVFELLWKMVSYFRKERCQQWKLHASIAQFCFVSFLFLINVNFTEYFVSDEDQCVDSLMSSLRNRMMISESLEHHLN